MYWFATAPTRLPFTTGEILDDVGAPVYNTRQLGQSVGVNELVCRSSGAAFKERRILFI